MKLQLLTSPQQLNPALVTHHCDLCLLTADKLRLCCCCCCCQWCWCWCGCCVPAVFAPSADPRISVKAKLGASSAGGWPGRHRAVTHVTPTQHTTSAPPHPPPPHFARVSTPPPPPSPHTQHPKTPAKPQHKTPRAVWSGRVLWCCSHLSLTGGCNSSCQ